MLFSLYLEFLVMIRIELYNPQPTGIKKAKTQALPDIGGHYRIEMRILPA